MPRTNKIITKSDFEKNLRLSGLPILDESFKICSPQNPENLQVFLGRYSMNSQLQSLFLKVGHGLIIHPNPTNFQIHHGEWCSVGGSEKYPFSPSNLAIRKWNLTVRDLQVASLLKILFLGHVYPRKFNPKTSGCPNWGGSVPRQKVPTKMDPSLT